MDGESSLDDFFAKKDKSKKKTKGKVKPDDNTGNICVNDDEQIQPQTPAGTSITNIIPTSTLQTKEKPQKKKDKDKSNSSTLGQCAQDEEEEWIDFEEKADSDFSGLKIQKLQITNRFDGGNESDQKEAGNEEGDSEDPLKTDSNQGPWNKSSVEIVPDDSTPTKVTEKTGKYVVPSMRSRQLENIKKKKDAPDIKNEEEFPTLGTGPPPDWACQAKTFKPVRTTARRVEDNTEKEPSSLLSQNKFAALT